MDDLMIIELYFARDEQAIEETDTKYGKLCFMLRMLVDRINIKQKKRQRQCRWRFLWLC